MPLLLLILLTLKGAIASENWCRFQDNLSFPDATVLGIYGMGSEKEIKLAFEFKKPVILILFNFGPVKWKIVGKNSKVAAVVTYGVHASEITGLPGTIPVMENSKEKGGPCIQKIKGDLGRVPAHASPFYHDIAQTRIKQISKRLFSRKKVVFFYDGNFQKLKRVNSF